MIGPFTNLIGEDTALLTFLHVFAMVSHFSLEGLMTPAKIFMRINYKDTIHVIVPILGGGGSGR